MFVVKQVSVCNFILVIFACVVLRNVHVHSLMLKQACSYIHRTRTLKKKAPKWVKISIFDGVAENRDIAIFIKTVVRPVRRGRYGEGAVLRLHPHGNP